MKNNGVSIVLRLTLALCLFALVSFCSLPVCAASGTPAFVRVVHAAPDIGTADVFLDGKKILSNFQFGTVTNYVALPAGPHRVQVSLIGAGVNAALITQNIDGNSGLAYTVAALGTKATGFSLKVFVDNNITAGNKAKVRIYHLSPGAGDVDVTSGNSMVINGMSYADASEYVIEPAGSYTFNVTAPKVKATVPMDETLKANTVTSIFTIGVFDGNPKFQAVDAQVSGVPGMPGTGSDPRPLVSAPSPVPSQLLPWQFFVLLALSILCLGGITRAIVIRQGMFVRSHK